MMNIKLLKYLSFFLLIAVVTCCSKEEMVELTQEQESQDLEELFMEIQKLASSENCEDGEVWKFTDYGSKACGGPLGFIAYSEKIDVDLFLDKIEKHKKLQKAFNEKWEVFSDCSIPPAPDSVKCESGKPVLVY